MEHAVSISGGCVDSVWTLIVRCSCGGLEIQVPRPNDVERAVRRHLREVHAA